MKEEIIRSVPLLASLPSTEIKFLAESLRACEYSPGTVFMKEGELANRFYILLDGQVDIIKAYGTVDERLLAVLRPGTFIGEMSLFNKQGLRSASVRARTPIKLLVMTRKEFDSLLNRQPMIAYDMVGVLSKRLNKSENATIRDLRQKNIQLTDAYQELKDAQAQLVEKEKLEHELELARLIQMSILPRNPPDCPGYVFDAFIEPMRAVGGDFYDIIDLGEDRIGVAVGDVSDHGVPAALFMAMTVTLLRAEALRSTSPKEVFSRVNRQLLTTNDTNMFVTALYGVLNCTTREFKYARAGHELPIVIHQNGELKQIPISNGMPLGLFEDPTFDEGSLTLRDHDTLFLYTDGLTDAIDPGNVHFGKERLHQILRGNSQHIPGGLCQKIFSYVQAYRGEMPQFDDITLLSLQVRP